MKHPNSTTATTARHRARPSILTMYRENQAAREHAEWSRRGLERPVHRGRHAAVPTLPARYASGGWVR